jgi:hypothetical protein
VIGSGVLCVQAVFTNYTAPFPAPTMRQRIELAKVGQYCDWVILRRWGRLSLNGCRSSRVSFPRQSTNIDGCVNETGSRACSCTRRGCLAYSNHFACYLSPTRFEPSEMLLRPKDSNHGREMGLESLATGLYCLGVWRMKAECLCTSCKYIYSPIAKKSLDVY